MRPIRSIALVCLALLVLGGLAQAQDSKKEAQLRTVKGVVIDKSENPIPGSVVFLRNMRTNAVTSRFADSDGNYRFSGLDPNAEYTVYAEFEGAKSPSKTVSSLDSRKEMIINLKVDRKKS
jgi:hypothetical protein